MKFNCREIHLKCPTFQYHRTSVCIYEIFKMKSQYIFEIKHCQLREVYRTYHIFKVLNQLFVAFISNNILFSMIFYYRKSCTVGIYITLLILRFQGIKSVI